MLVSVCEGDAFCCAISFAFKSASRTLLAAIFSDWLLVELDMDFGAGFDILNALMSRAKTEASKDWTLSKILVNYLVHK